MSFIKEWGKLKKKRKKYYESKIKPAEKRERER